MEPAYRALDLAPGASEVEVKAAYRSQVLKWHPDRHASSTAAEQAAAAARFKTVTEAYELLTDERARAAYMRAAGGRGASSSGRAYHAAGVNTDWASYGHSGSSGYTSTISRWELLRRLSRQGLRSFSHSLHISLAVLLLGGGLLFELSHTALWQARNKGKSFADLQAAVREQQERKEAQLQAQQEQQQAFTIRSAWADGMRGSLLPRHAGSAEDGRAGRPPAPAGS